MCEKCNIEMSMGNLKLPMSTAILNLTSCKNCPSKRLELCKTIDCCYAAKAERLYPTVLPFRLRQERYWAHTETDNIISDISQFLNRHRKVNSIRISEAGDVRNQNDIYKLDTIASHFPSIKFYGYSARTDLDFTRAKNIIMRVSSGAGDNDLYGTTIVRNDISLKDRYYYENGIAYYICRANCKKCNMCLSKKRINIVFKKH